MTYAVIQPMHDLTITCINLQFGSCESEAKECWLDSPLVHAFTVKSIQSNSDHTLVLNKHFIEEGFLAKSA